MPVLTALRAAAASLLLCAVTASPAAAAGVQVSGVDGQDYWSTRYVDTAALTATAERDQVVLRWTMNAGQDTGWCHVDTPRRLLGIYPDGLMLAQGTMTPTCPGRPDLLVDYVATVTTDTWHAGQTGDGVDTSDPDAPLAVVTATPRYPTGGTCTIRSATAGKGKWVTLTTTFPNGSTFKEREFHVPVRVRTTPGCWGGTGKYRYARFHILEESPTTHFVDARSTTRRTVTMLVRLPARQDFTVRADIGPSTHAVTVRSPVHADR